MTYEDRGRDVTRVIAIGVAASRARQKLTPCNKNEGSTAGSNLGENTNDVERLRRP